MSLSAGFCHSTGRKLSVNNLEIFPRFWEQRIREIFPNCYFCKLLGIWSSVPVLLTFKMSEKHTNWQVQLLQNKECIHQSGGISALSLSLTHYSAKWSWITTWTLMVIVAGDAVSTGHLSPTFKSQSFWKKKNHIFLALESDILVRDQTPSCRDIQLLWALDEKKKATSLLFIFASKIKCRIWSTVCDKSDSSGIQVMWMKLW